MALYYDLPVFKDVYQLILKIFDYTKDFPLLAQVSTCAISSIILISQKYLILSVHAPLFGICNRCSGFVIPNSDNFWIY